MPPLHASDQQNDILARLRTETADDHCRLEDRLDILSPPLSAERFRGILERFHGFYAGWEPAALRAFGSEPDLIGPRLRLVGLRRDLHELGVSDEALAALAIDDAAGALLPDMPEALGSLYVVEGSALGGQLIARALAGETWLPPGGLAFFSPHGADTGRRWQEFRQRVRASSAPVIDDRIVAGARATFIRLYHWMQPAFRRPAMNSTANYP